MNVITFSNLSRFAQRVSLIKNRATVNEDLDPSLVIKRLKTEILTLREEIGFLKVLNIILSFYFFLIVLCWMLCNIIFIVLQLFLYFFISIPLFLIFMLILSHIIPFLPRFPEFYLLFFIFLHLSLNSSLIVSQFFLISRTYG